MQTAMLSGGEPSHVCATEAPASSRGCRASSQPGTGQECVLAKRIQMVSPLGKGSLSLLSLTKDPHGTFENGYVQGCAVVSISGVDARDMVRQSTIPLWLILMDSSIRELLPRIKMALFADNHSTYHLIFPPICQEAHPMPLFRSERVKRTWAGDSAGGGVSRWVRSSRSPASTALWMTLRQWKNQCILRIVWRQTRGILQSCGQRAAGSYKWKMGWDRSSELSESSYISIVTCCRDTRK